MKKVIFLILILGIFGCSPSLHTRPDFGIYTNLALERQIINLNAPLDKTPVEGLFGPVAEDVYERHKKSFKYKIPKQLIEEKVTIIGVGR